MSEAQETLEKTKKSKKNHKGRRERAKNKMIRYFEGDSKIDLNDIQQPPNKKRRLKPSNDLPHKIGEEIYCTSSEEEEEGLNEIKLKPKIYSKREDQKQLKTEIKERLDRTAFVGNLPHNINRKKLIRWFKNSIKEDENCKKVGCQLESLRIRGAVSKSGGSSRGAKKRAALLKEENARGSVNIIAWVVFTHIEGVDAVLKLNNYLLPASFSSDNVDSTSQPTRHIHVDRASTEKKTCLQNTIFVGNIHLGSSEESLRDIFTKFGTVKNVRLVRDSGTGAVKGIGFIEFENPTQAKAAIDNKEPLILDKRELRVDKWRSVSKKTATQEKIVKKKKEQEPKIFEQHLKQKIILPTNINNSQRSKLLKKKIKKIRGKIMPKTRMKERSSSNKVV